MADVPNVDVNTDNLDEFELLLSGKATAIEAEAEAEEVEDEAVEDDLADDSGATDDEAEPSDETDGSEDEDGEEDEEEIVLKPKPKKQTVQERIDELTAARRQAERESAELRRRLEAVEQKKPEDKPEVRRPTITIDPDSPTPDDRDANGELLYPLGEFDPSFVADLTKYTIRRENEAYKEELRQQAKQRDEEAQAAKLTDAWEEKLAKSEEELEDLRPTIATLDEEFRDLEPQYGTYLAQTIMSMDYGPEVLYYLANNVSEARKIVAAGPMGATLALGKVEARIQSALSKPAAIPPRRTQAPKPPVSTRGNIGKTGVAPDTDNLDDFEKLLFKR
jgi:hypothetical protein